MLKVPMVYYEDTSYTNESHMGVGSVHSHQGSKKLNQDAAIHLLQVNQDAEIHLLQAFGFASTICCWNSRFTQDSENAHKKLQSDLNSLKSKGIEVQLDLKGSGKSSARKATTGRGTGSSETAEEKGAGRVSSKQSLIKFLLVYSTASLTTLKTARDAVKYGAVGSAVGAVTTAGWAWKYSKSLHGAGLSLAAGAVFGWTFGQEIAKHQQQLYRLDTMTAQT
ncbi:hypothetical protein ACH5RR_009585 [Cinchona calisaya]|uniref:Uncharacterized protein n=1 Tax=Cinchona calisaya TaxID=153742 RepID=A0ABD3AFE7_9GENT